MIGVTHASNGPSSRAHSKVTPETGDENSISAERPLRGSVDVSGAASMFVAGVTRIVTIAVAVPPKPSATWNVKVSVPAKSSSGS